jgi:membrane protein DedA with SNARE-associated domain
MLEWLQKIGENVGAWLYLIAALAAFGEAAILIGVVLPGEASLLVAGYFCHEGVLKLSVMIPLAIVAAIAGDSVGFEFGRHFGPRMRQSRLGRFIGEDRWFVADRFLHRHGGKAVLFGRMTALLRALMPSMAGMSGMHYPTFLLWNAIGGVLWGGGCIILGWAFASALRSVEQYLTWAPVGVLGIVLVGAVFLHFRRRHSHGISD